MNRRTRAATGPSQAIENLRTSKGTLIAVLTNEPSREQAIELTTGHTLVAPSSVHWEIGNALSAMIKRDRMTLTQAHTCVDAYHEIPLKLIAVDIKHALSLVKKLRMYAYDAYLLSCAMQTGSHLLTLDGALKIGAETLGIKTLEI